MKSVIGSAKFQEAEMEPIALGKTISNETFVVDLAKMPTLMAGATGQGKSVGLNAVLTSLLYKTC
jgi:S-DNA-T family DNA segregation ATPase FtsK/SpoIIIE